jgi:hypothetical protein
MIGDIPKYPLIFRVRQKFDVSQLDDVPGEVEAQLWRLSLGNKIKAGQTVAIAAGSRGIANICHIIKAIVGHIKRLGADPFIVPAMGSHGGGTAEGQQRILESYGITERFCGCPIRSSMETVIVCEADEGFPVHFDKYAYAADHVVLCNRIKTHTQFVGDIESGLMKIMLIGLGKHSGAKIYHQAIKDYSFGQILRSVADEVLAKCSIAAGVGIVENGYCQTARIEAVLPEQFEDREKELLIQAKQWGPRLPFKTADILLIDEVGKKISGTGFDLSVVGRKYLVHKAADDEYPKVRMIALRDLTDISHGNAQGMGLAEFCRTRLLEKVDVDVTRINALTSGHFTGSMLPLDYDTDSEMLQVMLSQIGLTEPPDAKLLWIRNTLALTEVECSAAYLDEAHSCDDLEILTGLRPLPFDASGNLSDEHMKPAVADQS